MRVTTHTTMGTMGNEQLDIFMSEGMKPHHIVIGHCDWNRDTAYHRSLLDRGCYIGFDTIGIDAITPDEIRIKNLSELTGAGYAGRSCCPTTTPDAGSFPRRTCCRF